MEEKILETQSQDEKFYKKRWFERVIFCVVTVILLIVIIVLAAKKNSSKSSQKKIKSKAGYIFAIYTSHSTDQTITLVHEGIEYVDRMIIDDKEYPTPVKTITFHEGGNHNVYFIFEESPRSLSHFFSDNCKTSIKNLLIKADFRNLDASGVVDASEIIQCLDDEIISEVDFSNLNFASLESFSIYASKIKKVILKNVKMPKITRLQNAFNDPYRLETIDFTNFSAPNIQDLSYFFYSCDCLTSLTLSFDTPNLTNINYMFHTQSLTYLNISNLDTRKVEQYTEAVRSVGQNGVVIYSEKSEMLANLFPDTWNKTKI